MNLEKLRIFFHVAREGSLKKVSSYMDLTPPSISKYIADLEKTLGYSLFFRKKRGLELTEKGHLLYESCADSILTLEGCLQNSLAKKKSPLKELSIVTTNGALSILLTRIICDFLDFNPDVNIKLMTTNENIDFKASKADVGVLPKSYTQEGIHYKKLITFHSKLFASKEYLEKYGRPKDIKDLANHRLISFYTEFPGNRGNVDWHLTRSTDKNDFRRSCFAVDSAVCQWEAAKKGLGIFPIAREFPYISESGLEEILENEAGTVFDVYFLFRSIAIKSKLSDAFYKFLQEEIPKHVSPKPNTKGESDV